MRIFLYEFVTGGGFLMGADKGPPLAGLLREGAAMITALAADFAAIKEIDVRIMHDPRTAPPQLPGVTIHRVDSPHQEQATFERLASKADWTVVIAPELSNHLLNRCRRVEDLGGRLLGPAPSVVELASDKQRMAEHLESAGVPVPAGRMLGPGQRLPRGFAYPAVLKPRLGAGSENVRLVVGPGAVVDRPSRLERFCPGLAVSVSFLCGPAGNIALPPCRQRLRGAGRFTYQGGALPLRDAHAARATALATRAIETLPPLVGYLGVDLVLGEDPGGRCDRVIEINPRLTTSYVGLRAALDPAENLAAAMLGLARQQRCRLRFRPVKIEFDADGTIREAAS
jgi:predicted ATP-grasp superfamily ATP-dependent carboligase